MQSPKTAIVKAITLLALENRAGGELSTALVKNLIELTPTGDDTALVDTDKETYHELRRYMIELAGLKSDDFPHEKDIEQRLTLICKNDQSLYDAFSSIINDDEFKDQEGAILLAASTRRTVSRIINTTSSERDLEEFIRNYRFKRDTMDLSEELTRLTERVSKLRRDDGIGIDERSLIDFSDLSSLERNFELNDKKSSDEGLLRTGWKSWNRMLNGGFRRGEDCVISALSYNYKSGAVLDLFAQLPHFNTPYLFDKTKKPLGLFVTMENDPDVNLSILYERIYENTTGLKVEERPSKEECAKFVNEFFMKNGWNCMMIQLVGQDTTIDDFLDFLEKLKRQGYEICFLIVDYFNLFSKKGIYSTFTGQDVTLSYQKIANYTRRNNIFFGTPHQLSTEAQKIKNEMGEGFAAHVVNMAMYDGSKRFRQEMSLEIVVNIIERRDSSYLEFARGKHRGISKTPARDRIGAMAFQEIGTLPWDVDTDQDYKVDPSASMFDSEFGGDTEF